MFLVEQCLLLKEVGRIARVCVQEIQKERGRTERGKKQKGRSEKEAGKKQKGESEKEAGRNLGF